MSWAYPLPTVLLERRYRWRAATLGVHHAATQAAFGRWMARLDYRPEPNDKSPSAIAAHRALGKHGYLNRSARSHQAV